MRNLSDTIIESLLTKTKEKVSAAKGATLRVDADYRRKMAVICEYTDIEKTLKLLKKHCK